MYNFDKLTNRFNTNSYKWNVKENELPMWVADMDFEVAPEIVEAMQKRLDNHVFGYNDIPSDWNKAYHDWWKKRYDFSMEEENIMFSTGVVPTISSVVRKLTYPAEKVLIQTPVYNIFFNSIINNGRFIVENKLKYENGAYEIDFADLEEKLSDPQVTLMILCNPHNPIGKIWSHSELSKIGALCKKHNVVVLSDEIHCDLTDPGKKYIPFASVNEECKKNSITCIAPTKAFNLAGLQTSAIYVSNPVLKHKVWRGINTDEIAEPNTFAIDAAIAAFNHGSDWNKELRDYIYSNKIIVRDYIKSHLPMLHLVESDATYLLWVDCSKISLNASHLAKFIREHTGLYISSGEQYGKCGDCFIRINIATQKERLYDGLERLKKGIEAFIHE